MGLGRVLVFIDQTYWRRGQTISTNRAFILFTQALYPAFDRLLFIGRLHPDEGEAPYRCVPHPGCEFQPLPFYSSLYALGAVLRSSFKGLRAAWCAVGRSDAALLGAPNPWALLLWLVCCLRRRPVVFLVRQDLLGRVRLRSSLLKRLLASAAVWILEGCFIALSRRTLTFTVGEAMYSRYVRPGAPVHNLLISLVPTSALRRTTPRTMPPTSEPWRLLWVGRLDPDKGLEVLLDTMNLLGSPDARPVELELVGSGLIEAELRERVRAMGLEDRVRFRGYVPFGEQLESLYEQSTAFVLPSNESEGFPQVILEAMAAGLPVVSTAVAGIPFVIKDGVSGLLVPPRNPKALADAILRAVSDPHLYTRLSAAGLELAHQYTLEAQRDRMLGLIAPYLRGWRSTY